MSPKSSRQKYRGIPTHDQAALGRPRARGQVVPIDLSEVQRLRSEGYSWSQIAAYFGVTDVTIHRRLEEAPSTSLVRQHEDPFGSRPPRHLGDK